MASKVPTMAPQLRDSLAEVLPKGYEFHSHHLSTPPISCEALCHAPSLPSAANTNKRRPTKPPKTYCEKHFLAISVAPEDKAAGTQVLMLGLEIYIYTTAFSTTIFVAKADSTGYLSTLKLPKGTPSPIREVTATFVNFLVKARHRRGTQLVVNLFARSQDQYLFPGSIKNKSKHVLDDRGLVRWWCRVVNGLLEDGKVSKELQGGCSRAHGYVLIPGLDHYETRAFIPKTANAQANWSLAHPLEYISPYTANPSVYGNNIPPRCLIPTFPDDPKARFVEELEESTPQNAKLAGRWKGPQTLDEFWESMAFRQECSSGRMTGFVWVVFDPVSPLSLNSRTLSGDDGTDVGKKGKGKNKTKLRGQIRPRAPRVKTTRAKFPKKTSTPHYYWPETGRGHVILDDDGYKRAVELLLHLEFKDLNVATSSTARWLKEVNMGKDWSTSIEGVREPTVEQTSSQADSQAVNNLSGLVRKKRTAEAPSADATDIKVLDAGAMRKKPKTEDAPEDAQSNGAVGPGMVNVLSTGLVRKKPKAT